MNKKVPFLAGALAIICAMFGIALLNVAAPATAHADTLPVSIQTKWDPINAASFGNVRDGIVDPVDVTYGTKSPDYDGSMITWSDAIKFYTSYDKDHPDDNLISDSDMVSAYTGQNVFVVVNLPAQEGFDAQNECYIVYVRQLITGDILVYGENAMGSNLGYTGAAIETVVQLSGGAGDGVTAEVTMWDFNSSPVNEVREVGMYSNPTIQLTDASDNYYLDTTSLNSVSITVSPRSIGVANKVYNGYVYAYDSEDPKADHRDDLYKQYPIVPVYTSTEEAAISHGHTFTYGASEQNEIIFPAIEVTENAAGDYCSVDTGYVITLYVADLDAGKYQFTDDYNGHTGYEPEIGYTYEYDIEQADPDIEISLKKGAHWYYGNYVVLEDGTVIHVNEADGLDELFDIIDINISSSQTNAADFNIAHFTWQTSPEDEGTHIGEVVENVVTLEYDGSNNYYSDPAIQVTINIEKAPIFVVCDEDIFEYTGSARKLTRNILQLYVYKIDNAHMIEDIIGADPEGKNYIKDSEVEEYHPETLSMDKIHAGEYETALVVNLDEAYYDLPSVVSWKINKAELEVTLDSSILNYGNVKMVYGDEIPALTLAYAGWKGTDGVYSLTTAPTATTTYSQYGDVGSYAISIDGGVSTDYNFTYTVGSAQLVVGARPLSIASTDCAGSVYGSAIADFSDCATVTYSGDNKPGIVNGDENVFSLACYEDWEAADPVAISTTTPVGTNYKIVILEGTNANYLLQTKIPIGNYTISPATITGVSAAQTGALTYNGQAQTASVSKEATTVNDQDYTFTYSATQDGEYAEALPTFTNAGTNHTVWYKVSAANHNTTAPASFNVTIAPKAITVTADAKESVYGDEAVALTATVSPDGGIVAGDSASSVYTLSCDASKTSNAGEYTITVNVVGNTNYTVTPANGTYTITPRSATIYCTYEGDGLFVTYYDFDEWEDLGDALEENLYWLACDGLKNGDNLFGSSLISVGFENQEHENATTVVMNGTAPAGMYFMVVTDTSDNYAFEMSLDNAFFTVNLSPALLDADIPSQVGTYTYNGEAQQAEVAATAETVDDCAYTFTYSATQYGEYTTEVPEFTTAGQHNVFYKLSAANHSEVSGMFKVTIGQKALTASFTNTTVTYNGQAQNPTFTEFTGLVEGDDVEVYFDGGNTITAQTWNDKSFTIVGDDAANYVLTTNTVVFTILQLEVTYTAYVSGHGEDLLKAEYNGYDHGLVISVTNRQGSDNVAITAITHETENQAGTYVSNLQINNNNNYVFKVGEDVISWEITQREVAITWGQNTFTYDAESHTPIVSLGNLVTGDEVAVVWSANTACTNITKDYTATIVDLTNANYKLPAEGLIGTLTIEQREITLIWDDEDEQSGEISFVYNGFIQIPEATAGGIYEEAGDFAIVTVVVQGEKEGRDVGEYVAVATELTNPNYKLPAANTHAYTITPKAVTVTYTSTPREITYGDVETWSALGMEMAQHAYYLEAEWAEGDGAFTSLWLELNTQADGEGYELDLEDGELPPAGKFYFIVTGRDDNYSFTIDVGEDAYLLVNPRPVTVTIADKTSVYGDAPVSLTAEITEGTLYDTDVEENLYTLNCEASATSNVGTYAITGTGDDDNYAVTFVAAVYTITVRNIEVTIDNKESTYGLDPLALSHAVTTGSIVNGDTGVYSVACAATKTSNVGTYAITGTAGNNANYHVDFVDGVYTITARPITVTIANKTSTYGENRVALSDTVTAGTIVNNDTNVYSLECAITAATIVGSYAITGTRNNTNYDITFINGTYTVLQREVTLSWGETTFVYDETTHIPAATAGNLVNQDAITVYVTGGRVDAGEWTATASELRGEKAGNYKLPVSRTHAFTITKPASYDKPIDPEIIAEEGLDLTNVFKNMDTTAEDAELKFEIATSAVVFDKAAIEAIAGSDAQVKLTFNTKSGEDAKAIDNGAVFAFEITLDGATFENGEATVSAEFENKAPVGKVARVYYVAPDGRRTNMNATFENGKVTFKTNHFSNYIVVYELSTFSIILIVLAILILVAAIVLVVLYFILKKKGIDMLKFMKKDKQQVVAAKPEAKKAEEKKAEAKEEKKEEAKEEVKEEPKEEPKQEKMEEVKAEEKPAAKKAAPAKKNPPAKKK